MNNKVLFIICTIVFLLAGCSNNNEKQEEVKVGIIGNSYPVDRATVSKMMALATHSKKEIISLDNVINFDDVKEDSWYNKYINCVFIDKDMSGVTEDKFDPTGNLTITQTQYLINKYDKNKKIKIDEKNKDKPVSYALWCDIYTQIVKDKNILEEDLVILATKETNKDLKEDYAITDKGLYSFEGIDINKYIDTKIKVLKKDNEVIAIIEVLETEPTLKRCYIEKIGNDFVDIFVGGAKKRLYIKENTITLTGENILADIKFKKNEVLSIEEYKQTTQGTINRIDNNTIRLNNTNYVLDQDFKVYYNIDQKLTMKDKEGLIIGQDMATYFVKGNENKIYGAIIDKNMKYDKIRVGINNNNNLFFDEINLKANDGLKILVKGQEKNLQNLHIKKGQDFSIGQNEIIIIEANNKDDGIIFENINLQPVFYERLEITKIDDKYIIINEINIEKYVEGLLATNSNQYKDLEMLKALSVVYRTTAISHIKENRLKNIGANLDNSDKYNIKESENIFKQAVEETKGIILANEDNVIKPTYFSHSPGLTGNSGEIWPNKDYYTYPTNNKPYLIHIKDFEDNIYENLQEEVNSNIFYKTKDINSLEKDSKWFRWSTTLEERDILKISNNIKEIYKNEKYLIKTLHNNNYIYKPIEDIGKIKDINVKRRGEAGNIMELEIVGDKNTVLLMSDLIIKKAITLKSVIDNNGEIVQNVKTPPSSYFVFDKIYDNNGYLKKITLYGGGYGHCVGLSLYGASQMAKDGKTYEDILLKYYKNINMINIY